MGDARPDPREVLAHNLRHLMGLKGWSQGRLSQKSGVSQKSISNILNQEKQPTLATVDKLAAAFDLNIWHVMLPRLPEQLVNLPSVEHLLLCYTKASDQGRHYIDRVAEREAYYGRNIGPGGEQGGSGAV
ncbi:helix-turn-helix domain-containing protein [Salinisphaera sp. LB1]|uniref:helix-turn-helix domain-containing protein n=1 Tax=Salinisphaera sp. LB1 TaxID=2183911 RepID=UPI000D706D3B|nr:helix-turn-helix transcriptional regulator [Salinisphaera sp. LB1]